MRSLTSALNGTPFATPLATPVATALAATLGLLLLASPARALPPERHAQLLLDSLREQSRVPALGAALWQGGALRWQGQSGWADREAGTPLGPEHRFQLASVSKLVTATMAAQLQRAGRLDVDAPLSGLMGDEWPAAWGEITARQLAAHSAGLPHYQLQDSGRGGRHYPSVAAVLHELRDRALLDPPGARYRYSSWGYTLLSRVVERAAGRDFLAQLPPGLNAWPAAPGVKTYTMRAGEARPEPPHDYSYSWGGAALAASPGALATWAGSLLDRDPALFDWMAVPTRLNDGREIREGAYRVGFGWRLQAALDGEPLMHHAGATAGVRTALALWPASGSVAVLLSTGGDWSAFIVDSAQLLAAPLRAPVAGLPALACPLAAREALLSVQAPGPAPEQRVALDARDEDGVCRVRIEPGAALAERLRDAVGHASERLALIGLQGEGLARAALVTPVGLIELRAQADGSLAGRYGSLPLRLRFVSAPAAPSR